MNLDTFKSGGRATIAGFVNSLYGTEGSSTVAAWVQVNLVPQRPVNVNSPGLWPDYQAMVTAINFHGPNCTQADLDAAISAWNGTFP